MTTVSSAEFEFLQPKGWASPQGFSNGIAARGRQVFIAGQIGWNAGGCMVGDDITAQTEQALKNIVAVLAEAGGERMPVGLFYHNPAAPRYDLHTAEGMGMAPAEKVQAINNALDRFAV